MSVFQKYYISTAGCSWRANILNQYVHLKTIISCAFHRWKNWVIRGIFTWIMIWAFALIIYGGPLALMITVS